MNNLISFQNKIQQSKGRLASLTERAEKILIDHERIINRQTALEEAQAFIQLVAKETQEMLKYNVVDIVNLALATCFPDEYEFDIQFEIKRGRTEAQLIFRKEGIDIDPINASGGGVVDVVAFALRISAWSLGHSDNVLIFDEPFRFLSKDLQPRAGEIMRKLSKHLKLQMLVVSHNDAIIDNADRIFEVTQKQGVSKVIMKEA